MVIVQVLVIQCKACFTTGNLCIYLSYDIISYVKDVEIEEIIFKNVIENSLIITKSEVNNRGE